jgi:polysaccharide biosynthesis protein PslH
MRVCVLTLDDPWQPIPHGGTRRALALIEAVAKSGHDVSVAYVSTPESEPPSGSSLELLPVDTPPVGERRMPGWIRELKRSLLPLPTMRGARISALSRVVTGARPDLLIVTQIRAAPYLNDGECAALWLDQADLWSAFIVAEIERRHGLARFTARLQALSVRRTERRWAKRAVALSTAGYADADALRRRVGRRVVWLPTPSKVAEVAPRLGTGLPTAGFLANFRYWPNLDAFELLKRHWAPALKRLGWRTVVAGLSSERLAAGSDLEVLGPVRKVEDFYAHIDITLAPIRLGAGIKVKVVESLMAGRPVVATSQAVQGFPPEIRSRIPLVSAEQPDMGFLSTGPPLDPGLSVLARHRFSTSAFETSVALTLDALGSGREIAH